MQKGFSLLILIPIVLVLLVGGFVGYKYYWQPKQINFQITDYDSCVRLQPDKPVKAIYPGQCTSPDGRSFTQKLAPKDQQKLHNPVASPSAKSDNVTLPLFYSEKEASLIDIDTSNWKTYSEANTGFYEIKYPPEWSFQGKSEGCGPVFSPNTKAEFDNPTKGLSWLTLCYYDQPFKELVALQLNSQASKLGETTIQNHPAVEISVNDSGGHSREIYIDVSTKDFNRGLVVAWHSSDQSYSQSQLFQKVISTLRFIN